MEPNPVKTSEASGLLREMARLAGRIAQNDGLTPTPLPFLQVSRFDRPTAINFGILQPSVGLIVQGRKRVQVGQDVLDYGPGHYCAAVLDLPVVSQIVEASPAAPYLAVRIALDPGEIAAIIVEAQLQLAGGSRTNPGRAAFVGRSDARLQDCLLRLLRLLDEPQDAAFLAEGMKRELIYRR